jgi:hypothetical protein
VQGTRIGHRQVRAGALALLLAVAVTMAGGCRPGSDAGGPGTVDPGVSTAPISTPAPDEVKQYEDLLDDLDGVVGSAEADTESDTDLDE